MKGFTGKSRNMPKVAFHTIGCKLNQFETEFMREQFERAGWEVVPFSEKADVYIINTCTVTSRADAKARQSIRQARKRNPEALVVAVGCYPQVYLNDVMKVGADVILGNKEKFNILEYVNRALKSGERVVEVSELDEEFQPMCIDRFHGYSRAFIKVQDGCDRRCSYCVVWKARGPSRSADIEFVVEEAKRLVLSGYEEVVLTGTNLGDYGKKSGKTLIELLDKLSEIPKLKKIRLSSIEPLDFTPEFVRYIASNEKICRHLHIPVQSASDRILKLMNRPYTRKDLFEIFDRIFAEIEDVGVGVDLIVGFPTETDEDFELTYRFVEEYPIYYMHIFSFSKRPGTPAEKLKAVRPDIIRSRWERLNELKARKMRDFVSKFVGKIVTGVVESRPYDETKWSGISENYIPLIIEGKWAHLAGKVLKFRGLYTEDKRLVVRLEEAVDNPFT